MCLIYWALCIGYQISQIVYSTSHDAGLLYIAYCIMDVVVVSCMILLYPVSSVLHVVHCSFHKFYQVFLIKCILVGVCCTWYVTYSLLYVTNCVMRNVNWSNTMQNLHSILYIECRIMSIV